MPSRCAYSFIICANAASVPPTPLGERDGGVVPRLHDHALDEDVGRDLRADLHEGARALRPPGVLADRDLVGELEPAVVQRLEHHVGGHELGEARRLHAVVGAPLRQHVGRVL